MRGMRWEAQVDWPTLSPSHSNEISGGGGKQREILQTPLSHNILIGLHNIGKMQDILMTLLKRISLHASDKWHQSAGLSVMHGLSIMTDHVLATQCGVWVNFPDQEYLGTTCTRYLFQFGEGVFDQFVQNPDFKPFQQLWGKF